MSSITATTPRLLRLPQVLKLFPMSRSTWWRGVKDGRFPQPLRIGKRAVAWRESDVATLIESFGLSNDGRAA